LLRGGLSPDGHLWWWVGGPGLSVFRL
jgi:hypothetical protein